MFPLRAYCCLIIILLGSKLQISTTINCFDGSGDTRFNCGNGFHMKYPFWPLEDEKATTFHCGYPGFGYNCSPNGRPTLNISNDIYYVTQFPEDNSFIIANREYAEKSCPRPRKNFTLDDQHKATMGQDFLGFNLNLFYNCSLPPPAGYNNITNRTHLACLDYNQTMRSYGFFDYEILNQTELRSWYNGHYCEESVVVPVTLSRIDLITDYLQTLQIGFTLIWTTPQACRSCENSGGRCIYDQAASNFSCSCPHQGLASGDGHCIYFSPHVFSGASATHSKIIIGIGVSAGIGGLIVTLLTFIYYKNQRKRKGTTSTPNVELFLESYGCLSLQRYKYSHIKKITSSFTDKLGQGGYGSVFKGRLVDGRYVAVKVLINDPKKTSSGEDFINEVATIGRTNHVNVVTLLGFCSSGSKRALVYEFMPNGSLEKFIYTKNERDTATNVSGVKHPLGWEKLYQISLGIARGLEYLHRGCNTLILHFDIKPHNILLDENFCPKISDFGLAKLCPTRDSVVSMLTGGRGTIGYIAPEVYCRNFGGVSHKSDVYSYGMMVLEMVGGRKNIDPFVENTSEIYFPRWIYNHLEEQGDRIEDILEFQEIVKEEMARKMIMVGLWCIQTNPVDRPSMSKVVDMLEGSIDNVHRPPKPFVDSSSSSSLPPKS